MSPNHELRVRQLTDDRNAPADDQRPPLARNGNARTSFVLHRCASHLFVSTVGRSLAAEYLIAANAGGCFGARKLRHRLANSFEHHRFCVVRFEYSLSLSITMWWQLPLSCAVDAYSRWEAYVTSSLTRIATDFLILLCSFTANIVVSRLCVCHANSLHLT